jgi:hypothetical protein
VRDARDGDAAHPLVEVGEDRAVAFDGAQLSEEFVTVKPKAVTSLTSPSLARVSMRVGPHEVTCPREARVAAR